jgi:hypothetical protein
MENVQSGTAPKNPRIPGTTTNLSGVQTPAAGVNPQLSHGFHNYINYLIPVNGMLEPDYKR